jgi:hypothetical protein
MEEEKKEAKEAKETREDGGMEDGGREEGHSSWWVEMHPSGKKSPVG